MLAFKKTEKQHKRLLVHSVENVATGETLLLPATGLTVRDRVFCFLIVCTKGAVGMFFFIVGSGALLRSSANMYLILNCVAMTFVLDIDDTLYSIFFSKLFEPFLEAPEFGVVITPWIKTGHLIYPYGAFLVLALACTGAELGWCGEYL